MIAAEIFLSYNREDQGVAKHHKEDLNPKA